MLRVILAALVLSFTAGAATADYAGGKARFERREGYPADGVLEQDEITRLTAWHHPRAHTDTIWCRAGIDPESL